MKPIKLHIEDLDAETRARIGLPEDEMDEPISGRLVKLGRVLSLMKGLTRKDAVWILSQALYAIQKEMGDKSEMVGLSEEFPLVGFVLYTVAKEFNFEIADLLERSRKVEVVEARQAAMFILWSMEGYTLTEIGQALGGRSAATISHGFQHIASRLATDNRLKKKVESVYQAIRQGESSESDYLLQRIP